MAAATPTGGSKTVATAGTGEALLGASTTVLMVYVRAKATNTGDVYIGDSGVDKDSSQQIVLAANQAISFSMLPSYTLDLNAVYVDVSVSGEGVDYLYLA